MRTRLANDEVTYFSNILKVWSKGMTMTTPRSKEVHKPRLRTVEETFKLLSIQFIHFGRKMSVESTKHSTVYSCNMHQRMINHHASKLSVGRSHGSTRPTPSSEVIHNPHFSTGLVTNELVKLLNVKLHN
ncbi:hypothetical protein E2C01_021006 [Portunus trituberculatus]|uniref:Uncharacterized protein n=1 Tax=Portunus trituberculatus TaxID=210409 RepID=A0A5B7E1C8_PORTR|nr:hypothetical protein [Portunus trituberculatus]